jgi:hypothetical protein
MQLAAEQRRVREELAGERQTAARTLAQLQVTQAAAVGERELLAADVGPVRYLAELIAGPSPNLEQAAPYTGADAHVYNIPPNNGWVDHHNRAGRQ